MTYVTNQVTRGIFKINSEHFCAHFILKIDEKLSLTGGFEYDFMMSLDSGLLFWAKRRQICVKVARFACKVINRIQYSITTHPTQYKRPKVSE